MDVKTRMPHRVELVEHVWITLADGCRLAARIWMPADAGKVKYPALLEYHPYRKRDGTTLRDERNHGYFAGHGYVSVRVDVRGTGESDGIMGDEYCAQEIDDAVEIIAWLARQDWCSGDVGMFGLSWGGMNTLATAARNPPALKAIISQGSTDDRFRDDCHFRGGCMVNEHIGWGATMLSFFSRPPDPLLVGKRWRKMWRGRLGKQPYPLVEWMRHQRRDAFWKQSSVCEAPQRFKIPLMYFGGWFDPYVNTAFRLIESTDLPLKVVIGPWAHKFPHMGFPRPAIGYLQEALRWWDHWLKDIDTGVMNEPLLRSYMMEGGKVTATCAHREGRWIADETWPSKWVRVKRFRLSKGRLGPAPRKDEALSICSPADLGTRGGEHSPMAWGADLPDDQRPDDAGSLVFDSKPLTAPLEILGSATFDLSFSVDRPVAFAAVRLCDVNPGGFSTRVALGLCNLNHPDGPSRPRKLKPGTVYTARVALDNTAYRFPAGHRIRLAISTQYWPLVMPPPELVTLTLHTKGSALALPVRAGDKGTAPEFGPPEVASHAKRKRFKPESNTRRVSFDFETGETTYEVLEDSDDEKIVSHGLRTFKRTLRSYKIKADDPASASMESHRTQTLARGRDWRIRTEAWTRVTCTPTTFELTSTLEAYEGKLRVFRRKWRESYPRDHH